MTGKRLIKCEKCGFDYEGDKKSKICRPCLRKESYERQRKKYIPKKKKETCYVCFQDVSSELYPDHGGTCDLRMPNGDIRRFHMDCYRKYLEE